ncbi:MAG: signal peptidase II [Planctomycetota bacterium]|nr:signal peptidase II [Planctomycetota bacterium]
MPEKEGRRGEEFIKKWRVVTLVICTIGLALDIISKELVFYFLSPRYYTQDLWLIDEFFSLRLSRNYGALFGVLPQYGFLFVIASFLATGGIIWYLYFKEKKPSRYVEVTCGILLAGVLGNLYDRLVLGYVRDFIGLHAGEGYTWPYFNIADAFICVAIGLIIIYSFRSEGKRCPHKESSAK